MRQYPHKPDSKGLTTIRQVIDQSYRSKSEKIPAAEEGKNPVFFDRRKADALNLACLAYAFEEPMGEILRFLQEACWSASKALQYGSKMGDNSYCTSIALALLVNDQPFQQRLQSMTRTNFINPNIINDEIYHLASEAYRDIAADRENIAQKEVQTGLSRAQSNDVDPDARQVVMPILQIQTAILNRDSDELAKAVTQRCVEIAKAHTPKAGRNEPTALLDVVGLGLLRKAQSLSIELPPSSIYLPVELLLTRAQWVTH
jgi:hypothetical protein